MKPSSLTSLTCGLAAAIAAWLAGSAWHGAHAHADPALPVATTRTAPNQLRYPPGSPQLSHLAIEATTAQPAPVLEPLPARIVVDEDHTVRVFSPVAGRAERIVARPGQAVRAGDVLAWLSAPDVDTAQADWRKAQADHEGKRAAYLRAQRLHEAGVIATRDLESAQADARSSQAELDRAAARVHGLGRIGPDGRFALRAPLGGRVVERHLNPGQEVRPDAADPAFVVTDPTHLDVVADVAESDVGQLHVGQAVRLESDTVDLSAARGRIALLGMAMDPATRRVPVRVHLDTAPPSARPEMFVRLAPLGDAGARAIAVPNSAIVTSGEQSFVFVEASPGVLVKTRVDFARRGRDRSYVREGLAPGARVVTQGAILLDAELASGG